MQNASLSIRRSGRALKRWTRTSSFILRYGLHPLVLGIASTLLVTLPVSAAEKIIFKYGSLELTVSVEALASYSKGGKVEEELDDYFTLLSPKAQQQVQRFLQSRYSFNAVQISRFLTSTIGEMLLGEVGEMIQTEAGGNGASILQKALILAADDSAGLTPISIMRHLPTDIRLNVEQLLNFLRQRSALAQETEVLVEKLDHQTTTSAASESPVDFDQMADIRQPGQLRTSIQTITLRYQTQDFITNKLRQRQIVADLYLPDRASQPRAPVIIMSHGLGGDRNGYAFLAQHLASYGFVVASIQHAGSDSAQIQSLFAGQSRDLVDVNAFIDRPLDVTTLLNELERRNQAEYQGQMNLQEVGIFGHSFGGYTALALAGAEIDFTQLRRDCNLQSFLLNLSLLLQCRALELPQQTYLLQDRRIKAVALLDPVNASLFGKEGLSGISIPVLWGTGSADFVTPAALEHVRSFQGLTTPHKYLGMAEGAQHINLNFSDVAKARSLEQLIAPEPETLQDYVNAIGLAFFKVYIAKDANYYPYLQTAYAKRISKAPYNLSFVQSVPAE